MIIVGIHIGSLGNAHDLDEGHSSLSTHAAEDSVPLMDVGRMYDYREERRVKLRTALTRSKLTAEQQAMVVNAMVKTFLGIPVASYTREMLEVNDLKGEVKTTSEWRVIVDGYLRNNHSEVHESNYSVHGVRPFDYLPPFPFEYVPPVPMVAETGRLLRETEETAVFVFELIKPAGEGDEVHVLDKLRAKMNWLMEVQVNKADQSPKYVAIKLETPVRGLFRYNIKSFILEFHYSFVESCGTYAISKLKESVKGSSRHPEIGWLIGTQEVTFSNIICEKPVRFLLPATEETSLIPL